jgi:hypothetical protein
MNKNNSKSVNTHLPSELDSVLRWFDELGIDYSPTRLGRYKEILDNVELARVRIEAARIKLESPWVKSDNLYDAVRKLDAAATLFEANELVMIHQGLAGRKLDAYLRPRLKELVSGTDSYVNESGARIKARNTGFELAVIARLANAGFTIQQDPGLADVVARLGDTTYIRECKRPQSEAGVYDSIRYARKQLNKRYLEVKEPNSVGFIALDVTKVFNRDLLITDGVPLHEMTSRITRRMDSFLDRHLADFKRVNEDRTAGILVRDSVLAWIEPSKEMSWIHKYGVRQMPRCSAARVCAINAVENALNCAVFSDGSSPTGHP